MLQLFPTFADHAVNTFESPPLLDIPPFELISLGEPLYL